MVGTNINMDLLENSKSRYGRVNDSNHRPSLWTRRHGSEWRPRRASVAGCQRQQQRLLAQHQSHRSSYQFSVPSTCNIKELIMQHRECHTRQRQHYLDNAEFKSHCKCCARKRRDSSSREGTSEKIYHLHQPQQSDLVGEHFNVFKRTEHISCGSVLRHDEKKVDDRKVECEELRLQQVESIVDSNNISASNTDCCVKNRCSCCTFVNTGRNASTDSNICNDEFSKNDSKGTSQSNTRCYSNKSIEQHQTSQVTNTDIITAKESEITLLSRSRSVSKQALNWSPVDLCQCSSRRSSRRDSVSFPSTDIARTKLTQSSDQLVQRAVKNLATTPSVIEKLRLQDKQRKYLILSMALKQMLPAETFDLDENNKEAMNPVDVYQHYQDGNHFNRHHCDRYRPRSCSFGLVRSPDVEALKVMPSQVVCNPVDNNSKGEQNLNVRSSSDLRNLAAVVAAALAAGDQKKQARRISSQTYSHWQNQRKLLQCDDFRQNKRLLTNNAERKISSSDKLWTGRRNSIDGPGRRPEVNIMRQLVTGKASDELDKSGLDNDIDHGRWQPKLQANVGDRDVSDCVESKSNDLEEDKCKWPSEPMANHVPFKSGETNNNSGGGLIKVNKRDRRSHSVQGRIIGSSDTQTQVTECDLNLEALIVESWLDDHPQFAHDYFVRKANRQLVDDWLLAHAKINNTNVTSQYDLQSINSMSRPVSQLSLNGMVRGAPWRTTCKVTDTNVGEANAHAGSNNSHEGTPVPLPECTTKSNSQSGVSMLGSYLNRNGAMTPIRKISATDFESRTGSSLLRPMLSTTPDGRLTFLAQPTLVPELNHDTRPHRPDYHQPNRKSSTSSINVPQEVSKNYFASNKEASFVELVDEQLSLESINIHSHEGRQEISTESLNHNDKHNEDEFKDVNFEGSEDLSGEVRLIFELVKNICDDLDIRTLLHKILKNVAVLINADRSSLFLVCGDPDDSNRHLVSQLFNVDQDSAEVGEPDDCIIIPWGTGLVGYVAQSGESLNIADCYEDPRFTDAIDQRTGYLTKHMLCAPIFDKQGEIVGVAQVINKRDGNPFTKSDEIKFQRYLQFCGIGLRNAQSFEHCQLENKRNQVLLDLARMVFEEQSSIEEVVYRIMLHTQSLLDCERCQVLLIDNASDDIENLLRAMPNSSNNSLRHEGSCTSSINSESAASKTQTIDWRPKCHNPDNYYSNDEERVDGQEKEDAYVSNQSQMKENRQHPSRMRREEKKLSPKLFSLVFDLECNGDNDPVVHNSNEAAGDHAMITGKNKKRNRNFPINIGITGYVAMTGETINIKDAHEHERFDPSVDEDSDFKHKSILCMPIRNGRRQIIGVSQLINKKNGRPFNKNDEDLFEAFSIFCGLGIHNTLMYERVLKIIAKQRVTFEVLSYHATAPLEEAKRLNQEQIPSCFALNLASLKFNDFSLDDQYMLKSCLRFFLDLDLIRRFQIDQLVFCNWILSVQKNYRKVTYHPIVGKFSKEQVVSVTSTLLKG